MRTRPATKPTTTTESFRLWTDGKTVNYQKNDEPAKTVPSQEFLSTAQAATLSPAPPTDVEQYAPVELEINGERVKVKPRYDNNILVGYDVLPPDPPVSKKKPCRWCGKNFSKKYPRKTITLTSVCRGVEGKPITYRVHEACWDQAKSILLHSDVRRWYGIGVQAPFDMLII